MEKEIEEKSTNSKKKNLALGGAGLASVMLAGYLGICAVAQNSDTIFSDATIHDVSVNGMTKEEAIRAVTASLEEKINSTSILLTQDSWNGVLQGAIASAEVEDAVEAAYLQGRESFLSSGLQYLNKKTGGNSSYDLSLTLSEIGANLLHNLLDEADAVINGGVVQTTWQVDFENNELIIQKGVSGVAVDRAEAETATISALSAGSNSPVSLSTNKTSPLSLDFEELRDFVYVEPQSASIDPDTLLVANHILGLDIDINEVMSLYQGAEEGEIIVIPLTVTEPEQTLESLESYLFADVLASASSMLTGTTPRQNNVILAASFCNDVILMPDDVFSFYEHCAPYSLANGYDYASAYVAGQTVDEVAGGICQVSSTIYYAVLHTDLEVVSRRNHQFTIDYLPAGMDATVYSTTTDFKFKNSSDYPIKVVSEVVYRNGYRYLEFTIYGTKISEGTIVPVSSTHSYVNTPTEYVEDPSVPIGSPDTVQTAYAGLSATVSRNHYDENGNLTKTETLYTDRYNSRPAIIHYNPADAATLGQPVTESETVPEEPTDTSTESPEVEAVPDVETTTDEVAVPDVETTTDEVVVPDVETVPDVESELPQVEIPSETPVPDVSESVPETVPDSSSDAVIPEEAPDLAS